MVDGGRVGGGTNGHGTDLNKQTIPIKVHLQSKSWCPIKHVCQFVWTERVCYNRCCVLTVCSVIACIGALRLQCCSDMLTKLSTSSCSMSLVRCDNVTEQNLAVRDGANTSTLSVRTVSQRAARAPRTVPFVIVLNCSGSAPPVGAGRSPARRAAPPWLLI